MNNETNNKKFAYLSSSNWRYDREEQPTVINRGERILAFKDKNTNNVCVKFVFA